MPIYEYECRECGHELEALQRISEAHLTQCPDCGTETLVRKISAPGFRLKGSGWYETDFKNKPKASTDKPVSTSSEPDKPKTDQPASSSTTTSNKPAAA